MGIKLASIVALGLLATSAVAAPRVQYEVTLIEGPLVGGLEVTALNNRGQVVGTRRAPDGQFAYVWRKGHFVDLQSRIDPTSNTLEATGINNRSQIVGFYLEPAGNTFRGFLIECSGTSLVLGPPQAEAVFTGPISDRGHILGSYYDANFDEGFFLNQRGNVVDFGLEDSFLAREVNSSGTVIGMDRDSRRAATWQNGVMTLIGPPASSGSGINDRGQVIGGTDANGVSRGFVLDRGILTLLPPVPGDATESYLTDINERGTVVGQSATRNSSTQIATIWRDGKPIDLNTLIDPNDPLKPFVAFTSARMINDHGQIVAEGRDSRLGYLQEYLLDPVRQHPADE
jgi:probable HAF family extracellular repeat protein